MEQPPLQQRLQMRVRQAIYSVMRFSARQQGESLKAYFFRHEKQFAFYLFVGGFVFDTLTLSDIDDNLSILQQFVYLIFIGWGLFFEIRFHSDQWRPQGFVSKIWPYKEVVLHFMLGSLLSIYSLFYFKSASLASSLLFMIFMAALMVLNEFPSIQSKGPIVRVALWSLCVLSLFATIIPIAFGSVGVGIFAVAFVFSVSVLVLFFMNLKKRMQSLHNFKLMALSSFVTVFVFLCLYLLKLTPPVPMALKQIGVYHKVEKLPQGAGYIFTEQRPWWKFWHNGDQDFYSLPGDQIYVFMMIYSPAQFADQIKTKWEYYDPKKGWIVADTIVVKVSGGRKEGYRCFVRKSNYMPGKWKVKVETIDGREIGRIGLTVYDQVAEKS